MPKPRAPKGKATTPTGRAALPAIMERARAVAAKGLCAGFNDVARALGDDGKTLRLWAGASERDEIDRLCAKVREPTRRR
jgi:hypothetical protein